MKAVSWQGVHKVTTSSVPDPIVLAPTDAIIKVTAASICGSDLHLYDGYIPMMERGDIIGHEFMGEVVETGAEVTKFQKGNRVVVPSVISCGSCYFCENGLYSLCDNTNPNARLVEKMWNQSPAGIYGYSHLLGGVAGAFAEYVRVPFADVDMHQVPDGLTDEQAVFVSDAFPTGLMAADFCNIQPGQVVAVWGCGGVGQMAIQSAYALGAGRVIAIDRYPSRLRVAEEIGHAEVLNYEDVDVVEALKELTGGRGPDACIDAVGMEAYDTGIEGAYDRTKQGLRTSLDRISVVREAILACRKGGVVSIVGVYAGLVDKFPLGAAMNKALTLRMGQQHGHAYVPRMFEWIQQGKVDPSFLVSHSMGLDLAQEAFEMFRTKQDDVMRVLFRPGNGAVH